MDNVINKATSMLYSGAIGSLGALASLLYKTIKGEKFNFTMRSVKIILAFLVARMIGEFIPVGTVFRDGILWITGGSAMQIMSFIELYGAKFVLSKTPIDTSVQLPTEEVKK